LGRLPTRPLSSEYITDRGPMHFTGAMIGLYASGNGRRSRGAADFDWFEYLPLP
jgi:alpha-N-arabinofuranosidase